MEEPSLFIDANEVYYQGKVNPFISLAWAEDPALIFDDPRGRAARRAEELVDEIRNYLLFHVELLEELIDQFQYVMLNTSILAVSKNISKFGTEVMDVRLSSWTSIPRTIYNKYNFLAGTGSELIFFLYAMMKNVYLRVNSRILAFEEDRGNRENKILVFDSLHRLQIAIKNYQAGMPNNGNLETFRPLVPSDLKNYSFSLPRMDKTISLFSFALRSTYVQNIEKNPRKISFFLILVTWLYWKYRGQNNLWFFDIEPYLRKLPIPVQEFAQNFRQRSNFLQASEFSPFTFPG